jgi:hypothetical protein
VVHFAPALTQSNNGANSLAGTSMTILTVPPAVATTPGTTVPTSGGGDETRPRPLFSCRVSGFEGLEMKRLTLFLALLPSPVVAQYFSNVPNTVLNRTLTSGPAMMANFQSIITDVITFLTISPPRLRLCENAPRDMILS